MARTRRVALALGSGGARGYAHIGAVQVLAERGFEVAAVAGSSMGALVGGVLAAGRISEFADWASGLKQRDVLRLIDPKWASPGAMAADRLVNRLNEFLTDVAIEDLPIPYTAVATDIAARREVWFQKGPLRSAVRASIAIPGVITPVVINGRLLADGGMLNPVPIEPTAAAGADLTIAVSLQAPRTPSESAAPVRATAESHWLEDWAVRLRQVFRRPAAEPSISEAADAGAAAVEAAVGAAAGAEAAGAVGEVMAEVLPADLRIADVLSLSLDAMQDLIARYRMAGLPPDIQIAIPVSACRVMDFHRAAEMIDVGRELTAKALDDWAAG
ncbi:putative NTE family protein [Actinoplanes ianthinogenes]|uniref:NTE family protein n=1 Tax=Actinoplanes ianthinogenes TaxID=122358 RepID=A0ABM7M613_9ACTN|nr:patatin-like phospholipase family protein [Actinoplanes ianthinogenes]BCJ47038.1 putative NTE family protein [Actinoplanes ianthinogenes]GGR13736.1 putative NTE family protein [Actinoplanes ianthinogenes]